MSEPQANEAEYEEGSQVQQPSCLNSVTTAFCSQVRTKLFINTANEASNSKQRRLNMDKVVKGSNHVASAVFALHPAVKC